MRAWGGESLTSDHLETVILLRHSQYVGVPLSYLGLYYPAGVSGSLSHPDPRTAKTVKSGEGPRPAVPTFR